jgi:LCP family protein required for cell wall assembly
MSQALQSQHPSAAPRQRRRRFSRGQRWFLRVLFFLILVAAGLLAVILLAGAGMNDAGRLESLAAGEGVYLIVGSDTRANLPDDLEGRFGDFAGARADVIILAQVANGRRQLLSIPRDLRVEIPGHGVNKINAAYAFGGPDQLVDTVANATGIRANHYLELEFAGFAGIVDALGGIELDFPHPARDLKSGLDVQAGRQVVNGATALAYVRSRSYEENRDGSWVSQPGGDFARAQRQREALLIILEKGSSPSALVRSPILVGEVSSHLTADSETSPFTLARMAWGMRTAGDTDAVTLPGSSSTEGGVSYVVRDEPAATEVLDAFAAGRPLPGA